MHFLGLILLGSYPLSFIVFSFQTSNFAHDFETEATCLSGKGYVGTASTPASGGCVLDSVSSHYLQSTVVSLTPSPISAAVRVDFFTGTAAVCSGASTGYTITAFLCSGNSSTNYFRFQAEQDPPRIRSETIELDFTSRPVLENLKMYLISIDVLFNFSFSFIHMAYPNQGIHLPDSRCL